MTPPTSAATAAAAASLPPRNRLARALHSLDDEQLEVTREQFVGPGAMSAIMQVELQREQQRRRTVRAARGELLPASAGARALASMPSTGGPSAGGGANPDAFGRRRRRARGSDTSTSSSSAADDDDDEDEDEDDDDDDDVDQSLGAWLATGSGALWLADQLGECLETASAGLGSVDDALRLKFRRLRRKAAAAFATGAGPFAMPVVMGTSPGGEQDGQEEKNPNAATTDQAPTEGLLARLKRRVRAKLLPAPVAGALNAVGVTADEYFATGQPLPLPFLVEKFIQRRAKVWVRRNLKNVFLIGGLAACASTLLVANAKAIALGVAAVAPPVPLPRPRNVWTRARRALSGKRRGAAEEGKQREQPPPPPLLYPYELGDAVGSVLDAAVAPGFLGPWIAIYVALRLIVGPDDRAAAAQSARVEASETKRRRRLRREQRRAGRRKERQEQQAAAAGQRDSAEPVQPPPPDKDDAGSVNSGEYGWV
jgi:hypothetical protein